MKWNVGNKKAVRYLREELSIESPGPVAQSYGTIGCHLQRRAQNEAEDLPEIVEVNGAQMD